MAKKLFQHVVQEQEKKGAWEKIKQETLKVFKGGEIFSGLKKVYDPIQDGGTQYPPEEKELNTTVVKRIEWQGRFWVDLVDFELIKDRGNQAAVGTILFEDVKIENIPVTTLLSLEKLLKSYRETIDQSPTLDLARKWSSLDDGSYQHGPIITFREEKKTIPVVLYPASKEHPAQVKEVTESVPVGTWKTTHFSGALTPNQKANLLFRIDGLIEACKDARMRANDLVLNDVEAKIGKKILDLINKGLKS